MSPLPALTIAGFGILILALAVYLLAVIALLLRTSGNVRRVRKTLQGLPPLVAPIEPVLSDINRNLKQVRDALA